MFSEKHPIASIDTVVMRWEPWREDVATYV